MAHRREDYPVTSELPWLDRPDALARIQQRVAAGEIEAADATWLRHWVEHGYVTFEDVLDPALCATINEEVDAIVESVRGLPYDQLRKKFENVFVQSAAIRQALVTPSVLARLDLLLGQRAIPYQTLNMPVSSEQAAHSDEILMTTNPPGYMAAVWFALEDITPDSGPFRVFPGSHRLPYLSAREVGIPRGVSEDECAKVYDTHYYRMIGERIQELGLRPWPFVPRRGGILIWHSNLLHGAESVTRRGSTRRSLIVHYYGERAEHYSDLFQRACPLPGLRP